MASSQEEIDARIERSLAAQEAFLSELRSARTPSPWISASSTSHTASERQREEHVVAFELAAEACSDSLAVSASCKPSVEPSITDEPVLDPTPAAATPSTIDIEPTNTGSGTPITCSTKSPNLISSFTTPVPVSTIANELSLCPSQSVETSSTIKTESSSVTSGVPLSCLMICPSCTSDTAVCATTVELGTDLMHAVESAPASDMDAATHYSTTCPNLVDGFAMPVLLYIAIEEVSNVAAMSLLVVGMSKDIQALLVALEISLPKFLADIELCPPSPTKCSMICLGFDSDITAFGAHQTFDKMLTTITKHYSESLLHYTNDIGTQSSILGIVLNSSDPACVMFDALVLWEQPNCVGWQSWPPPISLKSLPYGAMIRPMRWPNFITSDMSSAHGCSSWLLTPPWPPLDPKIFRYEFDIIFELELLDSSFVGHVLSGVSLLIFPHRPCRSTYQLHLLRVNINKFTLF